MKTRLSATLIIVVLATMTSANAADFDAGEFLQSQCTRCHDDSVYTRPDRRVDSLKRLESQVRMCDANIGTKLFDDDIAAVVDYLNTHYYRFGN